MPPPPPLPPPLPTTAPTSGKAEPSGGSSSGGGGGGGSGWVAAARGAALSTARILVSPLEGFVIALAFLAVDGAHDGAHGKSAPRSAVVSADVDEPPVLTTALTTARLPAGWQCGYDSSTGRPYYADARGHTTWERPTQPCAPGTAPGATAPDTAAVGVGAVVGADAVVGVTLPPIRPESVDLAQFCEMLTSELVCIWGDCARLRLMTIDCLPPQASAIGSRSIDCARLRLMTIDCLPHQASAIGSRSAAGSPNNARRTRSTRATRPGTLIATDDPPCMQVLSTARSPTRYARLWKGAKSLAGRE